jgi:hypothetical protein
VIPADDSRASRLAGASGSGKAKVTKTQSIWDEFTGPDSAAATIGKQASAAGGWAMDALEFAMGRGSTPLSAGPAALEANVKGAPIRQEALTDYTAKAAAQNPMHVAGPMAPMTGAMWASQQAYDYGLARPIATGLLAANPDSPLYQQGKYGEGFQPSDIQAAWNRTETVTPGQALAANPYAKFVAPLTPTITAFDRLGGVDNYDPWDDESMKAAQDNPAYRFFTGGTDLTLQVVAAPILRAGRIAAMRKAGLTNTVLGADDLAALRADFDAHVPDTAPTWGAGGPNQWGTGVHEIAGETNPARIATHPFVARSVGADRYELADILAETSDPSTVNEILLGNMGDSQALMNLHNAAPDIVARMAGMDDIVAANAAAGVHLRPTGDDLAKVNQIFDSALARDEYFTRVNKLLLDPEGRPRVNSNWKPTTGKVSQFLYVEPIRGAIADARYALDSGDWSNAPAWVTERLEGKGGKFVTVRMQWAGSRSPLGHVSNSGARPEEISNEWKAQTATAPFLRGDRIVKVDGVEMPAYEFVQRSERLLNRATPAELPATWQRIENAVVNMAADEYGVDREIAKDIADGYRQQIDGAVGYMRESGGYLYDEKNQRLVIHPETQRQILSSFQTLPMAEVIQAIRDDGSTLVKRVNQVQQGGITGYDYAQKMFRTNVLFRPGYTGKNSMYEPLVSRYIAHGTILADEGLWATMGNVGRNIKRVTERVAYTAQLHRLFDETLRVRGARGTVKALEKQRQAAVNELRDLHTRRYDLQQIIDNAMSEIDYMDLPTSNPAWKAANYNEVRGILVESQRRLEAVEAALDEKIPEWRQIVEPSTQADLRNQLKQYRAILGDNPEYVQAMEAKAVEIHADARARVQSPREQAQDRLDALTRQMERLRTSEQALSEDYLPGSGYDYTGHGVAADGKPIATGTPGEVGDVARGRDLQGTAIRRQMESLQQQIDSAQEAVASASDEVELKFTPNENAHLRQINDLLDRVEHHRGKDTTELRAKVDALQEQYDALVASKQSFEPKDHAPDITNLSEQIKALDEQIATAKGDLAQRQGRWRSLGNRLGPAGWSGGGTGDMTIVIGGEAFTVPRAFSQKEYTYGEGYRSESSAQTTNQLTYDPSARGDYEMGRWRRSNGPRVINPEAPYYWDGLAHVGNRFFRDDRMVQKYLSGWSRQEIAAWLKTEEGLAYQEGMGRDYLQSIDTYDRVTSRSAVVDDVAPSSASDVTDIRGKGAGPSRAAEPRLTRKGKPYTPETSVPGFRNTDGAVPGPAAPTHVLSESTTHLDRVLRLVDQYFPDKDVQRRLAEGELSAGELQAAMGARDDLSRIAGDDLDYHPTVFGRPLNAVSKTLDKIWQWIATQPEDRLARWPYYNTEFRKQLEARAKVLHDQGVKLDEPQWNALRQGAHRAALSELEKTFYNIRRYNVPVYSSRFLMTFPGAFFNSIYRYGRFLMREPERTLQTFGMQGNAVAMLAVDENGDKTDDIRNAKYLVVPGTPSETSAGVRFPVESLATLTVNWPSPSLAVSEAASVWQMLDVDATDKMKGVMTEQGFNTAFPYGINDNPLAAGFGAYQKDWWRARGGDSDVDVMRTTSDIFANDMYMWERDGGDGPMPTIEEAASKARAYYGKSGMVKFISPLSVYQTTDGEFMRQAWSATQQKFPGDTNAARADFMKNYGDAARWFTYADTGRTTYIPATKEAYGRVFDQFADLTRDLVKIDPNDPSYVGLLTYGSGGDFSAEVADALRRQPLPGDVEAVTKTLDPVEYDAKVNVSSTWDIYTTSKALYDAEHVRLTTLRDAATSEFERQNYRDQIAYQDSSFKDWTTQLEVENPQWAKQKNTPGDDAAKNATLYFDQMFAHKRFNDTLGKTDAFVKVKDFLGERKKALDAVAATDSDDEKKAIKQSFNDYVLSEFAYNDPDFTGLYDRYYAKEWGF